MKRIIGLLTTIVLLCSCSGQTMSNPSSTLRKSGMSKDHIKAMELLDVEVGVDNPKYRELLFRMLWVPGYTNEARKGALLRLWASDQEQTIRAIRQQLPRLDNWTWLTELCLWIANENITELDEALISSWAVPNALFRSEYERPEYLALFQMHGNDVIVDLIFDSLVSSNIKWKQGFRTRCWELLHRLSQREKLIDLLENATIADDDLFLLDLRKSLNDLGIVPHRREEILWVRELVTPEYELFWSEAKDSLGTLDESRRNSLEMRDVPMVVSIRRHTPKYLRFSNTQILDEIERKLRSKRHYFEREGGGTYSSTSELFRTHKESLTWGDAMAINTALTAMSVPEVRSHLFEYAKEDLQDESTEYGGVIALDKQGRFEILEFKPKIRHHNRKFLASQEMFDAAYTALFHFHFHAQEYRNGDHAGPGMGDKNYANNTRANCLVLTFVNKDTMNVDYYRHSSVVVDLGTIER